MKEDITPGFYWVKTENHKWYNMIVQVYGTAPFLKVKGWDRGLNERIRLVDPDTITVWGPQIQKPE